MTEESNELCVPGDERCETRKYDVIRNGIIAALVQVLQDQAHINEQNNNPHTKLGIKNNKEKRFNGFDRILRDFKNGFDRILRGSKHGFDRILRDSKNGFDRIRRGNQKVSPNMIRFR